jgi:tetratricopeptide (TPR) repeat protein
MHTPNTPEGRRFAQLLLRRSVPLFAALVLAACGARPATPESSQPAVELEFEPTVVESDGSGTVTDSYDAAGLFEKGESAFRRQDFGACEQHYGKLLDAFPQSHYAYVTLYNRGLCLEELGQHADAAAHFRRYAQLATELKEQRDGEFRMGANLIKTGNHPEALSLYDRLLKGEDLGPADRAECHLRRAIARMHLRDAGQAERDLKAAESYVREAWDGQTQGNQLMAEIFFRRAEIYQGLSKKVGLKLPVENMKGALADKVRFFRQAQNSYIDALNIQHSYWATAAGLRLGELYENFYRDVLGAEVPPDFDRTTKAFYLHELRKALTPLLEKSLNIYEKNITMSERIGAQNEWVEQTEARLTRLRELIQENHQAPEPEVGPPPGASKPAPKGPKSSHKSMNSKDISLARASMEAPR